MGYGMMGFGLLMMLLAALVLAGLVAVAVLAVMHFAGPGGREGGRARRLLDERYARGEIDDEEYQVRRRELG